jgi:hypothetical protein
MPLDVTDIVADITAAATSATTPSDLRARLEAFEGRHPDKIRFLRQHLLLNAVEFIQHMEEQGESDREVLQRVAAQELTFAAAMLVMSLYRRLGQPYSAGRFAIVAHTLFQIAETLPQAATTEPA